MGRERIMRKLKVNKDNLIDIALTVPALIAIVVNKVKR
tara:strand:+ start:29277 stop:29390 length:114 start_codon:yes stop_codon:yes gene_type:complete